jgi:hypothetical protein
MMLKAISYVIAIFIVLLSFQSCLSFFTGIDMSPEEIETMRTETYEQYQRRVGYLDKNEIHTAWMTPFQSPTIEFMYTPSG